MSKKAKYDSLVEAAYAEGKIIESYGDFNEDSEEGHGVDLLRHGALWLVIEHEDDTENVLDFIDEEEARQTFDGIKTEIDEE